MSPRPAWMPSTTELERATITTVVTSLALAMILIHWPAARRLVHRAFNP